MKFSLTALMKSGTGKIIVGLLIATTSVGAAAAAGADVPVLDTVISSDDDGAHDVGPSVDGEDEAHDPVGETLGGDAELRLLTLDPAPDADASAESEEAGDDATHGAVVSEFTQSVEDEYGLTGCEKGQATAAVARGDVDPESETIEDDLVEFIERCPHYEADEEVGEDDVSEPAESAEQPDPKSVHEEGMPAFQEAQAAYDVECGGDDEDTLGGEGDDEPMSDLCRELKEAAKAAHADWKDAVRNAREHEQAERRSDAQPGTSGERGQGKANAKNKDR